MGRPRGIIAHTHLGITVPNDIYELINKDSANPEKSFPIGNRSKIVTAILVKHYRKELQALIKERKKCLQTKKLPTA